MQASYCEDQRVNNVNNDMLMRQNCTPGLDQRALVFMIILTIGEVLLEVGCRL